jgi:hypothetical protein
MVTMTAEAGCVESDSDVPQDTRWDATTGRKKKRDDERFTRTRKNIVSPRGLRTGEWV